MHYIITNFPVINNEPMAVTGVALDLPIMSQYVDHEAQTEINDLLPTAESPRFVSDIQSAGDSPRFVHNPVPTEMKTYF